MWAVDDTRAEGTRIVTASHSVIQPTCKQDDLKNCYDHAVVRNVEVTVYDNDQPDVLITQLDPNTGKPDNNTIALEGWGSDTSADPDPTPARETERRHVRDLAGELPGLGLRRDRPRAERQRARPDARLPDEHRSALPCHAGDAAAPSDPTDCSANGTTYSVTFDATNWFEPVIVDRPRRATTSRRRTRTTRRSRTRSTCRATSAKYLTALPGGSGPQIVERVDALVIDDENPGVFVLAERRLDARRRPAATTRAPSRDCRGEGDTYQLRLDSQPKAPVKIALITDGQTDVDFVALLGPARSRSRRSAASRRRRRSRATSR